MTTRPFRRAALASALAIFVAGCASGGLAGGARVRRPARVPAEALLAITGAVPGLMAAGEFGEIYDRYLHSIPRRIPRDYFVELLRGHAGQRLAEFCRAVNEIQAAGGLEREELVVYEVADLRVPGAVRLDIVRRVAERDEAVAANRHYEPLVGVTFAPEETGEWRLLKFVGGGM